MTEPRINQRVTVTTEGHITGLRRTGYDAKIIQAVEVLLTNPKGERSYVWFAPDEVKELVITSREFLIPLPVGTKIRSTKTGSLFVRGENGTIVRYKRGAQSSMYAYPDLSDPIFSNVNQYEVIR